MTALSVLPAALKRLRTNAGLALAALVALAAAVALAVSVPLYAEGASLRLLQGELRRQEEQTNRSPFALLFRYVGAWNGPLEWETIAPADRYIRDAGLDTLDLPLEGLARHARTEQLQLSLPPAPGDEGEVTRDATLGFLTGMEGRIRIVDGAAPEPASDLARPVEAMLMRELADEVGVDVGDRLSATVSSGGRAVQLPVTVSALWEPVNADDPAWFFPPSAFREVALVAEGTYTGPVSSALEGEVGQVVWFARLDGDGMAPGDAAALLGRLERVRAQAAALVPGLRLEQSPAGALGGYGRGVRELTVRLFAFAAPVLGLVLYFVGLVAGMLVGRQRGEIALLKTRGVRDAQVLGISLVEWLLLGALALVVGAPLGLAFAGLMGRTRTFLRLDPDAPPLALSMQSLGWEPLAFGLGTVALALAAALLPAALAARRTLADEQRLAARALRPPLWQRLYLDALLLLAALYGLLRLRRGGLGADPFADPLLLLVPSLLCFALGLLAVRALPLLLEGLARLAARPNWTAPLVSLRALARQPGSYRGPLLLLILTLALATFSASMARTLDGALLATVTYRVGAPTQLLETARESAQPGGGAGAQGAGSGQEAEARGEGPRFAIVPVDEHLLLPGVRAATRVGAYEATVRLGGVNQQARLVGLDRLTYPRVVRSFDPAWAGERPLGALMNLLAATPDGILVSREVLRGGLRIGDALPAVASLYGDRRELTFRIVGAVDLWPGYYPQDGPVLVANLDYLFDSMGGQYPYDVWLDREPGVDVGALVSSARRKGIAVVDARDAAELLAEERAEPRRQGLFGLLSVGFAAAALLTLVGWALSALVTARRRSVELGVLGALGMRGRQVAVALLVEQVALLVAGVGAGTAIGLAAAALVVPALSWGAGAHPNTPAYPPQVAWAEVGLIYAVFALALLLTLGVLGWALLRLRLFQAVKLGDAN